MYNILICDDDKDIVNALKIYLTDPQYRLLTAYNGLEALETAEKEDLHLVLMDIMMPQMDGISAMVKLREKSNVPVILITAKGEDSDKILGLNVGADDYITKPFNPAEVTARVRAAIRRYTQLGAGTARPKTLRVGGLEMDDEAKQVCSDGEEIALTPKEYEILKLLMASPGKVFSPRDIYKRVWEEDPLGADSTVAVHIRHLREKIEIDPAHPRYLKVVWGQGYKIEEWKDSY
ncbi:MAG: response regulator transcription factor [Firmicutes bacterium]|nr:response regulator transcription factor [Bacillota bacterium]MBQ2218290.1 response regulator transcription factor [Bacillota bacterium]